jgi:hypothetical protein
VYVSTLNAPEHPSSFDVVTLLFRNVSSGRDSVPALSTMKTSLDYPLLKLPSLSIPSWAKELGGVLQKPRWMADLGDACDQPKLGGSVYGFVAKFWRAGAASIAVLASLALLSARLMLLSSELLSNVSILEQCGHCI